MFSTRTNILTLTLLFFMVAAFMLPTVVFGAEKFVPLQPVPGFIVAGQENDVPEFLNNAFRIGVGVAGILAVIMIIIGGFEYMTSDVPGAKSDGKAKIRGALIGIAIILLSYLVLFTINPDIVKFRFFESRIEQTLT